MRVIDKVLGFHCEDIFKADERRRHELLLNDCCHLWTMGMSETDPKWQARFDRLGQVLDRGIAQFDEYQNMIWKEMQDEDNNN